MLDAARRAVSITQGRARADLAEDIVALALVKLIEIIGEAAGRVTRDLQAEHPEVPWRRIVGMRHVLVHDYDQIDLDRVWAVVQTDLPPLIDALEPLVARVDRD